METFTCMSTRVAKCHEYDKYIRVKIFAGWGKKSGRRCNLAKFSLFWEDLHHYARFLYINQPNLIDLSTFVHQNYPFCTFYLTSVPKLSLFTRFSWGKIQFKYFAPCKRIDISQLCPQKESQKDTAHIGQDKLLYQHLITTIAYSRQNPL